MRTLIELYDDQQIYNMLSYFQLKPDRVVFLYRQNQENLIRNSLIERKIEAEIVYQEYTIDTLNGIVSSYQDEEVYIDVHGGNDLAISMVSAMAAEKGLIPCYAGMTNRTFYWLIGTETKTDHLNLPVLTVREIVELYGGKVRDLPEAYYDDHGRKAVEECLDSRRKNTKKWNAFCKAMGSLGTRYKGYSAWKADEKFWREYQSVLDSIPHIFDRCEFVNGICEMDFHDTAYQILVTDTGVPFEYETYYQIMDSKAFDDVDLRVNIDWNGGDFVSGDPNSELDVVASKDCRLISISCKAGNYDQQAIYEVQSNAVKFGGLNAVPVLCADINMERPEYVEKAEELNVLLIEHNLMKEKKAAELILEWMKTH